ncbi:MAG: DNA polymerase Y family protein, partial [Gammaproteobacteria bacterium]|nr:DNA polymerase Y family protein [Gammaproteobacteria bacterium]
MLWLCLHLPQLPLDIFTRATPADGACAVSDRHGSQQTLLVCNEAAHRLGIKAGMTLGAAYALSDSLHVYVRNTAAEDKTLKQLATWCGRFSSMVSLVPPQALVLEVGGSLVFFGGLERLLQQFHEQLSGLGYHFALAVAPTPLGATLLARARYHQPVIDQQLLISTVMRCPISVLHLTDKQYDALTHLGLKTIGECLRLPREGLARRLGVDTLLILDKALGRIPDPRQAFVAPHRFKSTLLLPAD